MDIKEFNIDDPVHTNLKPGLWTIKTIAEDGSSCILGVKKDASKNFFVNLNTHKLIKVGTSRVTTNIDSVFDKEGLIKQVDETMALFDETTDKPEFSTKGKDPSMSQEQAIEILVECIEKLNVRIKELEKRVNSLEEITKDMCT